MEQNHLHIVVLNSFSGSSILEQSLQTLWYLSLSLSLHRPLPEFSLRLKASRWPHVFVTYIHIHMIAANACTIGVRAPALLRLANLSPGGHVALPQLFQLLQPWQIPKFLFVLGGKWCNTKAKVRTRHSASCAASFSIQNLSVGDFCLALPPPKVYIPWFTTHKSSWQVCRESKPCWACDPISIMFRLVCSLPLQL